MVAQVLRTTGCYWDKYLHAIYVPENARVTGCYEKRKESASTALTLNLKSVSSRSAWIAIARSFWWPNGIMLGQVPKSNGANWLAESSRGKLWLLWGVLCHLQSKEWPWQSKAFYSKLKAQIKGMRKESSEVYAHVLLFNGSQTGTKHIWTWPIPVHSFPAACILSYLVISCYIMLYLVISCYILSWVMSHFHEQCSLQNWFVAFHESQRHDCNRGSHFHEARAWNCHKPSPARHAEKNLLAAGWQRVKSCNSFTRMKCKSCCEAMRRCGPSTMLDHLVALQVGFTDMPLPSLGIAEMTGWWSLQPLGPGHQLPGVQRYLHSFGWNKLHEKASSMVHETVFKAAMHLLGRPSES